MLMTKTPPTLAAIIIMVELEAGSMHSPSFSCFPALHSVHTPTLSHLSQNASVSVQSWHVLFSLNTESFAQLEQSVAEEHSEQWGISVTHSTQLESFKK